MHPTADLSGYNVDVAVVTETHLKKKHADHHFAVAGYTLFRRDRVGRRGGGVAVYVSSRLSADVWTCPGVRAALGAGASSDTHHVYRRAVPPAETTVPDRGASRLHRGWR